MKFRSLLLSLSLVAVLGVPAFASTFTWSAGSCDPDPTNPSTPGRDTNANGPFRYQSFDGTTNQYCWLTVVVPSDTADTPGARCAYTGTHGGISGTTVRMVFSFQAFPAQADGTPSTVGNTTSDVAFLFNGSIADEEAYTSPSGSPTNIWNAGTGADCASGACRGRRLNIRVGRTTDSSSQAFKLTTVTCEFF